jgi:hypothetical protein
LLRALGGVDVALGVTLVARPAAAGRVASFGGTPPPVRIVRLLGARYAIQGGALLARPETETGAASALIDALHAASMLAACVLVRRTRPAAATSAAVAAAGAAVAVIAVTGRGR